MKKSVGPGRDSGPGDAAPQALPPLPAESCLFLDVDGTLVDFAATPHEVRIDSCLIGLLEAATHKLGGALALISGRPIADLDRLFSPLVLPAAGVHGLERRDARGMTQCTETRSELLASARAQLQALVAGCHGLVLEDKQAALAVHFRGSPQCEEKVRLVLASVMVPLADDFELLEGNQVIEVKPSSRNKSTAVDAFMQEAPFAGRTPVFIGDDRTDRDGFAAVQRHGGLAVAVGERVQAPWRLPHPAAVREWLASFVATAAAP